MTFTQRIALADKIGQQPGESWHQAVTRYAETVLHRHPRTIYRYLSGESPMPGVVLRAIEYNPAGEPLGTSAPESETPLGTFAPESESPALGQTGPCEAV